MSEPEQAMLASVEKRVTDWSNMTPFYTDKADGPGKTEQSHATEAVLNAVILSSYDVSQGRLSPVTRLAFDEAWALQEKLGKNAGGWKWQDFHLAPWESSESAYQGAALMAVALGDSPSHYAEKSGNGENLQRLQQYLQRQYDAQPLMSKLYVLWASAGIPKLLDDTERAKLIREVADLQLSDGGWALSSLDEQSKRHELLDVWGRLSHAGKSDGCATGLIVLVMEKAGVNQHEKMLERGLKWLEQNQLKDGSWWATSLNARRDDESDIGRFMSDAATGYASLALDLANRRNVQSQHMNEDARK